MTGAVEFTVPLTQRNILAIDPGTTESAWVHFLDRRPVAFAKAPNDDVLRMLSDASLNAGLLAVEMIASYGMPVGAEVFETCVWIGRFVERARMSWLQVYRRDVKLHLCKSAKAKDGNIRAALIDLYGGKDMAIGRKAVPGPLYGVSGDCWAALAVARTVHDLGLRGCAGFPPALAAVASR